MITFYDIPSMTESKAWSPNTWKARYSLNFKGIPYKTIWVEYPDIEPLCKAIGATPTRIKADGRPHYTLPVIQDHSSGAIISDSARIAAYLDETYPDKPILIPAPTSAFQAAFRENFPTKFSVIWEYVLPKALSPSSEEYFRQSRRAIVGDTMPVEDDFPTGEKKVAEWKKFKEGLGSFDGWMRKEDLFMMGDIPSFADFMIASFLLWVRLLFGRDSEEWKDIESWHGGRWARLMAYMEQYETVV